jgi:hypothetical protein
LDARSIFGLDVSWILIHLDEDMDEVMDEVMDDDAHG